MKTRFDILKFLEDYQIPYIDKGSNCSPGWINITCPICDDSSEHLGFRLDSGAHSCWKASQTHTLKEIILGLTPLNEFQVRKIIKRYTVGGAGFPVSQSSHRSKEPSLEVCSLPPETAPLASLHKNYLIKRGFDPDTLAEDWRITGTNHLGDFRFRIIIPIFLHGQLISFQSRDITGKSDIRYKACAKEKTVLSHKDSLYGIDQAEERRVILVEGIFDVWRLNKNNPGVSVSTFGTKVTDKQILMLIERFDEVNILFDSPKKDKNALTNAKEVFNRITILGKEAHIYNLMEGDPADLNQAEADDIVNQIIKRKPHENPQHK